MIQVWTGEMLACAGAHMTDTRTVLFIAGANEASVGKLVHHDLRRNVYTLDMYGCIRTRLFSWGLLK